MPNLWSGQTVAFHPLIEAGELKGFAISNGLKKVFYENTASYPNLLREAQSIITFDHEVLLNSKHCLKTLYYQLNSQVRFQTLADIVKHELYTESDKDYYYMGLSKRLAGAAKQCILEANFMRTYYIEHHHSSNKIILDLDNSLSKEFTHKDSLIEVDQAKIRTDLSLYQLEQWKAERKIFHKIGHPVVSINQLSYKQQQDEDIQEWFTIKNQSKAKYESLVRYLDIDCLNLKFDITGSATGRIFCRDNNTGLFAPDNQYKTSFSAPEDKIFISADYSKQEASILAIVAEDKRLQRDLLNKSFYAKLAKFLTGVEDKATGKTLFYSLIYGVSTKNLASSLNISEDKAEHIKEELADRYSKSTRWLKRCKQLTENYFGRRLYESTANAYIQSTAADIVRQKLLETIDFNPVCIFSDNIIYCVPQDNVTQCKEQIKIILEAIEPFKLGVSIKSSNNLKF